MNYKVLMISIVISLAAGALIERKFAAAETKTEIREIIKDRIVTVTKIVTEADGTKTEDSTSTEDTTKVVDAVKTEKAPLIRKITAEVLGRSLLREDIFSVLNLVTDNNDPLGGALLHGVQELAIEKIPIENGAGAYEQAPYDLTDIRKQLFHIAVEGGPKSKLANQLLTVIEQQRDLYGRPPSEPRHPDITSGYPFPLEIRELSDDKHNLDIASA